MRLSNLTLAILPAGQAAALSRRQAVKPSDETDITIIPGSYIVEYALVS